jgi:hypothetical protein
VKIPARIARIVARLQAGERLCKTIIHARDRDIVEYHYEPSGDHAPFVSSEQAIRSGLLVPNNDGILADSPQTWRAKEGARD